MPSSVGVLGRRGARRPTGTFAEALLAVPPSGADPSAAAPPTRERVVLRPARVEDDPPTSETGCTETQLPYQA
jgi:hypothetical protein